MAAWARAPGLGWDPLFTTSPELTGGGIALGLLIDALWVRTESDAVRSGEGNLAVAAANVTRLRVILDASRAFALEGGGMLTLARKLGLRRDGLDAGTGTGVEDTASTAGARAAPEHGLMLRLESRL